MKQRVMALIFVCIIIFSSTGLSGGSAVSHAVTLQGFAGGTGTSENPWQIATAAQLNDLRYFLGPTNDDKHFILVENIDLGVPPYNEGVGWLPIGAYPNGFTGSFNGNGKTITGLYINNSNLTDVGLFGDLHGGHIKNLALVDVFIVGKEYVGGLVGYQEDGVITDVSVTGSVTGHSSVGGLIGQLYLGSITNTWVAVEVWSSEYAGGLVGPSSGTVVSSYYNVDVARQSDTGKGEPRSTADMTYPYNADTTYIGWDFVNIWDIQEGVNSGYPFIRQQIDPNTEFAGGNGSEADPFQITTIAHLNNVRNYLGVTHTDKHFLLMNNIDLTSYVSSGGEGYNDGKGWQPIGYTAPSNLYDYTNCFYGSFNGGEYTISGLMVNRQPTSGYEQCGLFGVIIDADVRNLNLSFQVTGTQFAGGLAGYTVRSIIDNIQVAGEVTGNNSYIGGLIGAAEDTVISDSSMTGKVSGTAGSMYTGGLIGLGVNATITNCHSDAMVSGYYSIGGLVGRIISGTSMTGCYATGSVTAPISDNKIDNYTGGLVGSSSNSSISLCYATGNVSGSAWVGGLCGINSLSTISDSYASGDATGIDYVGGLSGENNYGNITNSYAVGAVNSSGTDVGGLVGVNITESIYNSFYDTQTTGQSSDIFYNSVKGTPKTTAEMKQGVTFTGWDFINIWGIVENVTYPYLQALSIPPTTYTVNFSAAGGNGTLGATVDSLAITTGDQVEAGKTVEFTATPAEGYRVKEWTLETAVVEGNTTNTYSVEALAGSITVTVEFEMIPPTTYPVNFSVTGGNGTLGATVDSLAITTGDQVEAGKNVEFTATPAEGYRVKEWTLETAVVEGNTTNTYSVEALAGPITVTVEFELIPPTTYTVNFSVTGGNGTLGATVDSLAITTGDQVEAGKNVEFTATPAEGYRVKEWTLETAVVEGNTTNTYSVEALAGPITVTVEFEPIPPTTYIVTYDVYIGSGSISATDDGIAINSGSAVEEGSEVVFTAVPAAGWQVADWYVDGVATGLTDPSYTITSLGANVDVEVEFELIPPTTGYIVSVSSNPSDGGTIIGGGNYETGDRVKVSATANENYVFIHWTEGSTVVSKGATYNFKMGTENRNLVAHFKATVPATSWLVTTSARPSEGGSVSGGGLYEEGDLVEVVAIANSGYRFINWTEGLNVVSTDAVYSFTMGTTERSLTANFLTVGTGWPKEIKLSATGITDTSVTLQLSQAVPDAKFYLVYIGDVLYESFDATNFGSMKIDMLKPLTFYTFTVQALYPDDIETSDGPSLKVKTKK